MNCPKCNTPNDQANLFCINCGQPLNAGGEISTPSPIYESSTPMQADQPSPPTTISQPFPPPQPVARSVGELLQVLTIRLLVILLSLWVLKVFLNWLPFIKELRIPSLPLSTTTIINTIVYIVVIVFLFGYARMLLVLWPQALPRYREAATFLAMLIFIITLIVVYYAIKPWVPVFIHDNKDAITAITIIQVVLFITVMALLIYAIMIIYQRLPYWMPSVRQKVKFTVPAGNEVACLNCGNLNKAGAAFCTYCGQPLTKMKT